MAIVECAYIYYDDLMKTKYQLLFILYSCRANKVLFKVLLQ